MRQVEERVRVRQRGTPSPRPVAVRLRTVFDAARDRGLAVAVEHRRGKQGG